MKIQARSVAMLGENRMVFLALSSVGGSLELLQCHHHHLPSPSKICKDFCIVRRLQVKLQGVAPQQRIIIGNLKGLL